MAPTQCSVRATLMGAAAVLLLAAPATAAPVEVYAGSFVNIDGRPITDHPVRVFDNIFDPLRAPVVQTNASGFITVDIEVGHTVFFILIGTNGWKETTTGISTVPAKGLTGVAGRIILQVPDVIVFTLFTIILPGKLDPTRCHVVATVADYGKTYEDCPQGHPGVTVSLSPKSNELAPFYLGTFSFINKTNPFVRGLTATSWDGGVVFRRVDVDATTDVHIHAQYKDAQFTPSVFRCMYPGQLINLAPNQGPRALAPLASDASDVSPLREYMEQAAASIGAPFDPVIFADTCHWHRQLWLMDAAEAALQDGRSGAA